MRYRIGIDVGGTFTDLVLAAGARLWLDKHPTTPADQSEGVLAGLLFSCVDPVHERRVREIAAEELPGVMLSLSHEVMPSAPEFERTSTTLVNAYVGPRIERYLATLEQRLRAAGFAGELLVMQSNGGVMPGGYVAQKAVAVMGSGPAGGVNGAAAVADAAGIRDFISVDMGGTSYDVCLVRDGTPQVKAGWNWHHRYLIGLPMVDVQSVGAGGGSIARVVSGTLKVGPESAGAVPGPVCYGRGGVEPTVTDANLVLGYLSPERFWDGQMRLDVERAHAALRDRVAAPLGLSVLEAAEGIFRLVNANMANAVRKVSAGRGIDPRPLVLVAFGGNGPLHAGMQAAELGIRRIFVPKLAPAFSALGLLLSDHVVDEVRSYVSPVGRVDLARANALLGEMEAAARRAIGRPARLERLAALCYPGQTFDLPVPLETRNGTITPRGLSATVERFHRMHEELHTYACREEEPILRALRVKAVATEEKPALPRVERVPVAKARLGARKAFFGGRLVPTPVYDGTKLGPGATIDGPALVDEPFTTVVVYPGQQARVDRFGNYAISVGRACASRRSRTSHSRRL